MLSIIVIQNGAPRATLDRTVEAARSTGIEDLSVVAQKGALSESAGLKIVSPSDHPLATTLSMLLSDGKASQVILLDGRLAPTNAQLQAAIGSMTRARDSQIAYVPMRRDQTTISVPTLATEDLVRWVSSNPEWPLMCVALDRVAVQSHLPIRGESMIEILAHLVIKAVSSGQSLGAADTSLPFAPGMTSENSLRMSSEAMSRVLQTIIDSNNIEDLFTEHPWSEFEQESAAAAYHTLAALFVKFGDLASAQDSLRLSDSFEDSPRSLALKGLIAQQRGETLGAVANMVASLQQYEIRKQNDGSHYLSFAPGNVEKISGDMEAGLAALNQADNEAALQHFAQAVFSFDPFFKDSGLIRE